MVHHADLEAALGRDAGRTFATRTLFEEGDSDAAAADAGSFVGAVDRLGQGSDDLLPPGDKFFLFFARHREHGLQSALGIAELLPGLGQSRLECIDLGLEEFFFFLQLEHAEFVILDLFLRRFDFDGYGIIFLVVLDLEELILIFFQLFAQVCDVQGAAFAFMPAGGELFIFAGDTLLEPGDLLVEGGDALRQIPFGLFQGAQFAIDVL
ncbi:MAG TPA: hypothetical protein PKI62_10425 [bacterium]|nr:hypothetical protein [bacterium]HPR87870.1 hypothetical protein [bacterium]